jgi:hypothetical protein
MFSGAGELVQAGCGRCLRECGEHRTAGAAATIIPSYIDREFADAAVAGPIAEGERSRKGDGSRRLSFGYDHKLPASEPLGNLSGRARLGLEGGDTIGNAFILNRRYGRRIGEQRRTRPQFGCVDHRCSAES